MKPMVRGMGLIVLAGALCAVSGCYGSAVSIAKCASKSKTCQSVEQDFAAGSTLRVRNEFGPVSVAAGDEAGCQITGRVYVHARKKHEAQEIAEQVRIVAEPNDGTLAVRVDLPPLEDKQSAWVDLRITIPSRAHVDCETEFGRIKIAGIEGDIRASTEFGGITCDEVTSGKIDVSTEFGPIYITCTEECPADLVADVQTEFGKIRFKAPESFDGNFDVRTDFGSARAKIPITSRDEWTGDRKIATTGEGKGRLSLRTEFGSIRLR